MGDSWGEVHHYDICGTELASEGYKGYSGSGASVSSGHLRRNYLIKYAYFDKVQFRTVCFYQ